jgi:DNA-binding CsgD family transcriptional regulator
MVEGWAMAEPDPLRIVEAGYRWFEDERAWLRGLAEAARPFAVGEGVAAYAIDLEAAPCVAAFAALGARPRLESRIAAFTQAFDPAIAREVYAPTEFCGNSIHRLARLARAHGTTADELARGATVSAWAVVGGDPRTRSVAVAFPHERRRLAPSDEHPQSRQLGLAAAHLSAALRLRRLAAPGPDAEDTESVLGPSGRVLHATGDARARGARESLVEAVVRRARARGRLRQTAPGEAAALWSVLVAGRWSIVDFVDRDGKHLVLARKNPVRGPDVLALTADERDVVWLAALGHSRKYIAYELGLAPATVTRRLASAQRKLRAGSRRELLRRFGRAG